MKRLTKQNKQKNIKRYTNKQANKQTNKKASKETNTYILTCSRRTIVEHSHPYVYTLFEVEMASENCMHEHTQ